MKTVLKSLLGAISLYSKVPVPQTKWSKENQKYLLGFFPVVGVILATVTVGWKYVQGYLGISEELEAVGCILLGLWITGGIHLDGFMDTMDARHSYGAKEEKLRIMKDPHTGAFAVIYVVGYFFTWYAIWHGCNLHESIIIVLGFVLSRTLSGLGLVYFPMAKEEGMAYEISKNSEKKGNVFLLGIFFVGTFTAMTFFQFQVGVLILFANILLCIWYRVMSQKEFGGISGDLAGYFLCISEVMTGGLAVILI